MNIIHKKKSKNVKKHKSNIKRAGNKSALRNNKNKLKNKNFESEPINLDNEIIIGMPKANKKDKKTNKKIKKNKLVKKVKKLTEQQIKRRNTIVKILKWTSLILIVFAIIIFIILSPIFNIKKVEVKSNSKLTYEQILSLSGIKLNDNTFKYSKSSISKNIKQNAYIEQVKINRKLPDTLKITVKERVPKFMLIFGNAYVYINNQGYILEISNENINLPIIKGYKTIEQDIVVGNRLSNEDLESLSVVIKILEFAESEEIAKKITQINIEEKNDYQIIMDSEKKTIHLGDCSMLETRMLWIKTTINETKDLEGDIFINMNLNNERPFFREKV